jgi:hemolysin activation/secretion protein
VQSSLEEGEEPGTTDLVVEMKASRRVFGQLEADNYGFQSTGVYRLAKAGRIDSPLRLGDNSTCGGLVSEAGGQKCGRDRLRAAGRALWHTAHHVLQ